MTGNLFRELEIGNLSGNTIFLDVDGTIVPDKKGEIEETESGKIRDLSKENEIFFCSNGSPQNAKRFALFFGGKELACKKPFTSAFRQIVEKAGTEKIVVIGDKFLTDGLLAKFLGARFVKTRHLLGQNDSPFIKFSYFLDDLAAYVAPYFELMRPWQWIKNLLVFAPLFFMGNIALNASFLQALVAFAAFSIAASGVYVLNDVFDRNIDRLHPKKKDRPIASGVVTVKGAYVLMGIILVLEAALLAFQPAVAPVIVLYIFLNGAYTAWFKHMVVVDILCVASFYMMRIIAGGVATKIPLSSWIMLCTFFGALFVIVGKRRSEYRNDSKRKVLEEYSETALDFMLGTSAGLAIITYGIWSVLTHDSPYLVYSTLFVVLALFRMLNHIYTRQNDGESPESLVFKDKWILFSFVLWLLYVFFIFYK